MLQWYCRQAPQAMTVCVIVTVLLNWFGIIAMQRASADCSRTYELYNADPAPCGIQNAHSCHSCQASVFDCLGGGQAKATEVSQTPIVRIREAAGGTSYDTIDHEFVDCTRTTDCEFTSTVMQKCGGHTGATWCNPNKDIVIPDDGSPPHYYYCDVCRPDPTNWSSWVREETVIVTPCWGG